MTDEAGTASCDDVASAAIDAIELTPEEAATEAYESVLVTVSGAVSDSSYDCSVDGSSCDDEGLWEVGGSEGVVVYDMTFECSDWDSEIGEVPVTGVMMYRWERRRLTPRVQSDFGG